MFIFDKIFKKRRLAFIGYALDIFFILSALACIPLINLLFEARLKTLPGTQSFLYRVFDLLTLRLKPDNLWFELGIGSAIALFITIVILVSSFYRIFMERKLPKNKRSNPFRGLERMLPDRFFPKVRLIMHSVITGSIFEEMLYRGIIFIIAELAFKNTAIAILISSSLFCMSHFRQGRIGIFTAFFTGVVLATALYLKGSLFICIFGHAMLNLITLTILVPLSHHIKRGFSCSTIMSDVAYKR